MPPSSRVVVAGLFHETHTFLEGVTPLSEFSARYGEQLFEARGDGSPLGGVLDVAMDRKWNVLPSVDLRASPSALVAAEVVSHFLDHLRETLRRAFADGGIDGVFLVLHGAMAAEGDPDVEGTVAAAVRDIVGNDVPVAGVLDLHGNISPEFCTRTNLFVAYRQNPHADACAASKDAAYGLERLMSERSTCRTVHARPGIVWPPPGTGTAFEPMSLLETRAREIEARHPEILAVNVFGGFAYADTPDTGVCFTACTLGDPAIAEEELVGLCDLARERRAQGNVTGRPLSDVLDEVALAYDKPFNGPIVLAEPSDNIGGGAPGDGTSLLRAFVERKFDRALVAINDPEAVAALQRHTVGERVRLAIGGRGSKLLEGPYELEVELLRKGDGRFRLEDPHSHLASMCGSEFDMGDCAVVRHAGVIVLLTSNKTAPFDLGQWRSQGLYPERFMVVAVKAAVAHRKVYDPIASQHFTVETPGPCASDLRTFPFQKLPRPIYPLDGG
jgi:microcystin degradation protein MlrC